MGIQPFPLPMCFVPATDAGAWMGFYADAYEN